MYLRAIACEARREMKVDGSMVDFGIVMPDLLALVPEN
jgi:hypothetical protein